MARLAILSIFVLFLFTCNSAVSWADLHEFVETKDNNIQGIQELYGIVEKNNDFIKAIPSDRWYNQQLSFLQPRIATSSTGTTITYISGKRVNGDRLVASSSQNQKWTVAQNVTQKLTYPRTGVGAVITYIEVIVDQSTNMGRGVVTSGGIGQRQIAITIEAQKTYHFRQNTFVYGYGY